MPLALIQARLPEEVLLLVLGKLAPYQLGKAQCVCKQWRALCERETLWRPACQDAFRMQPAEDVATDLRSQYRRVPCCVGCCWDWTCPPGVCCAACFEAELQ